MIMNLDVEDVYTKTQNQQKTLQKFPKNEKNNPLKTKRILNTEIKAKWGLYFRIILPGRRFAPLSPISYTTDHRRLLLHT